MYGHLCYKSPHVPSPTQQSSVWSPMLQESPCSLPNPAGSFHRLPQSPLPGIPSHIAISPNNVFTFGVLCFEGIPEQLPLTTKSSFVGSCHKAFYSNYTKTYRENGFGMEWRRVLVLEPILGQPVPSFVVSSFARSLQRLETKGGFWLVKKTEGGGKENACSCFELWSAKLDLKL